VTKVGAAGRTCEMPFGSKFIIKLVNHGESWISAMRILTSLNVRARKGRGLDVLIMQIIYLINRLSDF
jgi:hypothetical protein